MDSSSKVDAKRVAALIEQFKRASAATTAERMAKDQLLDELQDAVGLGGKMVTENDILRRGEKLRQAR